MNPTAQQTNNYIKTLQGLGTATPSSQNSSILSSTPVNKTPDVTKISNPTPAQSPTLLSNNSSTLSNTSNAVIGNVNALNGNNGTTLTASQNALLNTTQAAQQNSTDTYNQDKATQQSLINQYLGQGADQAQQEQAAGVPQLQTQSNQLTQQYLAAQNIYNQQYQQIATNGQLTKEQASQQINELQTQHGFALTDIGIRQSIAQNDYNNAESLIQHQIQLKYGAMKDAITFGQQFLQTDAALLTQKEQNTFQANLAVQQQMYTQQTYYAQLNASTNMDLLKSATANNAPQDIIDAMGQKIAQGAAPADVAAAGAQYTANGNYQPVQTGIDLNTGLPIYSGFNSKTGQMQVKNPGNSLGVTGSQDTIVNGVQLGVGTTLGSYAQNDNGTTNMQQITNVKSVDAKIQSTVGNITDVTGANLALKTVSPNSPITGQMVMNAAQKFPDVPISTAIAVMQAETQCGTDGSKGSQLCNFGNVGNTNTAMANGKPVAMNPQQGVDAVFQNLSKRLVQSGQIDPAVPPQGQSLTPQQVASQTIAAAPALLQPAMGFTASNGATFIDSSKVDTSLKTVMNAYASSHNIPVLNTDQVSLIKGADEAIRNITNVIAPAWAQIAPSNVTEMGINRLTQPFSNIGGTDFYSNNKTFSDNVENLAQQIKALSGSAPKLGLIGTATKALPNNQGYFNILGIGGGDTLKEGNSKMQRTLDLLNQTIQTYLPGAQPVTLPTPTKQTTPAPFYTLKSGQTVYLQSDGVTYN